MWGIHTFYHLVYHSSFTGRLEPFWGKHILTTVSGLFYIFLMCLRCWNIFLYVLSVSLYRNYCCLIAINYISLSIKIKNMSPWYLFLTIILFCILVIIYQFVSEIKSKNIPKKEMLTYLKSRTIGILKSEEFKVFLVIIYTTIFFFLLIYYVSEPIVNFLGRNNNFIDDEKRYFCSAIMQTNATLIGLFLIAIGIPVFKKKKIEIKPNLWVNTLFLVNTILMVVNIVISLFAIFVDTYNIIIVSITFIISIEIMILVNIVLLAQKYYELFTKILEN